MQFSVVIPLYNKAPYIEATIASVLAQTCQDFEIVVVDDGSSDAGPQLVAAIGDPRIRLLRQPNGGVSRARNTGIQAAVGDLVCFLDADDWYGRHYLACIAAMAARHPGPAMYATAYQRVGEGEPAQLDGEAGALPPASPIENFYEYRHRHGPFFFTSSVVIPRRELQAMQPCFPVGEQFGEDQDVWFRVAERLPLIFNPARLVAYRIGVADSLSVLHGLRELPPLFARLEQRARNGTVPAPMRRAALRIVADARLAVARYALIQGRRRTALAALRDAARDGRSRRWWVTAALCLFANGGMVQHWEMWRSKHKRAASD